MTHPMTPPVEQTLLPVTDLFGTQPESARRRMARLRAKAEEPFVRNEHGLWCPQCGELIAEWEWVGDCDCCGYPSEIEDYDEER